MSKLKIFKNSKKPNVIILLVIFLSCSLLIFINGFTIKILSGSRAYVNGESHYSKGQKDAVRHLITYLYTEEAAQWELYKVELSVPQGDGAARIALINGKSDDVVKVGFRAGRNHEDDLQDLIWVFRNFKTIPFIRKAIQEWEEGDALIGRIEFIGNQIRNEVIAGTLTANSKDDYLSRLSIVSDNLTINEREFSNTLGEGTREIRDYLIITNIIFVLIIFGSVSWYYSTMIKKLLLSKHEIDETNKHLHTIILDLERTKTDLSKGIIQQKKIIGTISHDIRSPLKYIVLIGNYLFDETKKDKDSTLHKYSSSMLKSSTQLYEFTKILIEYSNIYIEDKAHKQAKYSFYDLVQTKIELFKEIAANNNSKLLNTVGKNISSHVNERIISIIVHNLLDNAVKNTADGVIEVCAYTDYKKITFWVRDTGVGMSHDLMEYYTNLFKNKESEKLILNNFGIGLHFVLELLILIKGNITFSSVANEGTTITIEIDY